MNKKVECSGWFLILGAALLAISGCGGGGGGSSAATNTVSVSGTVTFPGFTAGILRIFALDADVLAGGGAAAPTTLGTTDIASPTAGPNTYSVSVAENSGAVTIVAANIADASATPSLGNDPFGLATTTVATADVTSVDFTVLGSSGNIPAFTDDGGLAPLTSGAAPNGPLVFPLPSDDARLKFDEAIGSDAVLIRMKGTYNASNTTLMPYYDNDSPTPHWHVLINRNDTSGGQLSLTISTPANESSCSATITDIGFVLGSAADITMIVNNTGGARRVRMWVFPGHDFTAEAPDVDTDSDAGCSGIAATNALAGAAVGIIGQAVTVDSFRVVPLP